MMVKIMSDSKKIKGKVHFYVSILAGAVHIYKPPVVVTNASGLGEANRDDNIELIVLPESPDLLVKEIIKLLVSEKLYKKFVTNMCRIIKK